MQNERYLLSLSAQGRRRREPADFRHKKTRRSGCLLVRSRRLELPRVAPQRPQRCASTNSATTARGRAETCRRAACSKWASPAQAHSSQKAAVPRTAGKTEFSIPCKWFGIAPRGAESSMSQRQISPRRARLRIKWLTPKVHCGHSVEWLTTFFNRPSRALAISTVSPR